MAIDCVIASTNDADDAILMAGSVVAMRCRPTGLATDGACLGPAAIHAFGGAGDYEEGLSVLLQLTFSARSDDDVEPVIGGLGETGGSVTVEEVEQHPRKALPWPADGFRVPQDIANLEVPWQAQC